MELINVEPAKPRWAELASVHGIETESVFNPGRFSGEPVLMWNASIELFGEIETETGESPREAVVRLIHRLQLTGWQEVTV